MLGPALFNLDVPEYVNAHREEWAREGVARRLIWEDSDYVAFLTRGPTPGPHYHVGPGDEIFYQLEGELQLHCLDGDKQVLVLGPGELFFLPAGRPHSPRRPEGSWTVVIERKRLTGEADSFVWFCEHCNHRLHEVALQGGAPADSVAGQEPAFMAAAKARLRELGACPGCGAAVALGL